MVVEKETVRFPGRKKNPARSIASLFTARRAFPKAPRVNKGKIICGQAKKKEKLAFRAAVHAERKFVYSRKHANTGTCSVLRARPHCNFRVDY